MEATNKHGRRKINPLSSLSIGGEGGIAGLLVFGGALAIAGFMAVTTFASNKRKAKGTHDHHQPNKPKPHQLSLDQHGCDKSQEDDDYQTIQNLSSLLQHSKIQQGDDSCCWNPKVGIDQDSSSDLLSAQPAILAIQEEKSEVKESKSSEEECLHQQEIVFSDYSRPESAVSSNEECLESLFNKSSTGGQAHEVESQDGLTSHEDDDDDDDDDDSDYNDDDDEDEDVMSDDDDEDMMSDDVPEIDYSSKTTETTSEAVWGGELAEGKLKGSEYCVCSDDSDADYVGDDEAMVLGGKGGLNHKLVNMANGGKASSLVRSWAFPLLLLALLLFLLLLSLRPQQSFYVLDDGSSVIVP